jgi:hypothetical protein
VKLQRLSVVYLCLAELKQYVVTVLLTQGSRLYCCGTTRARSTVVSCMTAAIAPQKQH